jgi:hypothetical protein
MRRNQKTLIDTDRTFGQLCSNLRRIGTSNRQGDSKKAFCALCDYRSRSEEIDERNVAIGTKHVLK